MKKRVDFLIIGGGISGLIAAQLLHRAGKDFALVESSDALGGEIASPKSPYSLNRGLKLFKNDPLTIENLKFIEELIGSEIRFTESNTPPLTFEKNGFRPFVGFGSKAPREADAIENYTFSNRLEVSPLPSEWLNGLASLPTENVFLNSEVSSIEVDSGRVSGVTINGQFKVDCEHVFFCAPIDLLPSMIDVKNLSPRFVKQLAKNPFWTSITLDLVHENRISESNAVHVLMGGSENSIPVLGAFSDLPEGFQASQWMIFLDYETVSDVELAGAAVREIKKQIKRAYPNGLLKTKFERILYSPNSHGIVELKTTDRGSLPGIENLYPLGSRTSGHLMQGAISRARAVLSGFDLCSAPLDLGKDGSIGVENLSTDTDAFDQSEERASEQPTVL